TVNYVGVKSYADKYITLYSRYDREMQYFDFLNNRTGSISFENEIISHVFYRNNFLYIITDKGVHVYNSDMEEVEWYSYDYMKKNNPNFDAVNTFYYTNDDFWGHCISTSNAGLFTLFEENLNNLLASSNLAGYDFVGYKNDSTGYWWKVEDRSLVEVCKGVIASKRILPKHLSDINLIIHGNDNKPLLLNKFCVYNINADNTLSSVTKPYDSIVRYTSNYEVVNTLNRNVSYFDIFFRAISDILPLGTNKFLYLGTSVIGAIDVTFVDSIKTIFTHNLDIERYEHALLDSVTNNVICYATDKIMLLTDSQKRTLYQKEINALFGINDIESIAIDKYGHIFIKSAYKMLLANRDHATVRSIMNSYNMSGSKVHVTGDILTAVGTFGVVQYKIHPSGTISEIGNFPNVKNTKYNKVFDVQFSKNHVIFKTDNGVYTVNTSTGKKLSEKPNYRVVLNLNDQLLQIKAGDTISIDQETNSIGVDIIKPTGTGELKINYKFVDSSYTNTGYNIIIPDLSPNNYYDVTIVATDATWQSSPIHFQVYVTPYWWQTNTAIRIFFMLGILLLIGFVYIIIIMTRRIVNRNNERRNQQRELELKSIYSQINPHFIFNTLSTAQYFVKKNKNKEAYNHISQFSDLLRSYIKSSRNKYITIAEETENLKNYLELQLSRFENMFTYEIEVGDNISPLSVQIPSLLLQPIVENALNHGIFHKEEAGHLSIKFEIDENDDLQCIVDDNGVGRNKAKEIGHERMKKATSYGTILINELVDTFNKYEKINISLKYIDKKFPETGTTVIITIKNLRDAK
ncbi:MAG: histidine kinase, partial [Chitinophagaceae bacterium]|nr:histidine kinase [Chitinophagaceae bacterium]